MEGLTKLRTGISNVSVVNLAEMRWSHYRFSSPISQVISSVIGGSSVMRLLNRSFMNMTLKQMKVVMLHHVHLSSTTEKQQQLMRRFPDTNTMLVTHWHQDTGRWKIDFLGLDNSDTADWWDQDQIFFVTKRQITGGSWLVASSRPLAWKGQTTSGLLSVSCSDQSLYFLLPHPGPC